jgi:hypothetical protein
VRDMGIHKMITTHSDWCVWDDNKAIPSPALSRALVQRHLAQWVFAE